MWFLKFVCITEHSLSIYNSFTYCFRNVIKHQRANKTPKLPVHYRLPNFLYICFPWLFWKSKTERFLGHSGKHYSKVNKIGSWLEDERPVSVRSTFSLCCWNITNINCYCSAVLHYTNICVNSHCEYMKCFDGQRGEFPHVLVSPLYEATALCALTELSHSCCSASAWVLSSLFSSFVNGLLTKSSSAATQQFPSKCSKPALQNFFSFFF